MADDQAWADLGLTRGSDPETVKAAWRQLALTHHPDVGGDCARFLVLRKAYEAVLMEAVVNKGLCLRCRGLGYIMIEANFRKLVMRCPHCGGGNVQGT